MTSFRSLAFAAAALALLVAPSAASARKNPYTPQRVCGAGYKVIDSHRLYDTRYSGAPLLATVFLTYNGATGKNCAVTIKRYRVGKTSKVYGDFMYVEIATRPLNNANTDTDHGNFRYFAGPSYVSARGKCVRWGGGATLLVPARFTPRGYYESAFRSRWSHCG